ncbi:MAG: class I SAM-dependent methyltransferase [Deltaproteobacteria bacterium]|nr:class I SAM-dependent methyltransferase [Deltaproteobacteria bacterium]
MTTRQRMENREYVASTLEDVPCPICRSSDNRLYERFGDRHQYSYMLCNACQLAYLTPRPIYTEDFIHDAYEYYTCGEDNEEKWDMAFLEKTRIPFEQEVLELKGFARNGNSLLDVGSYMGNFLYAAKDHFNAVYGLDVSSRMASFIEDNLQIQVFLHDFRTFQTELRFSCIRMSHVIEHVPDPHLFLQKAISLLEEDGILLISVPNMFGLSNRTGWLLKRMGLRKGKWPAWKAPEHLIMPTIPSMLRLFEMNNCRVLSYYTYSRKDLVSRSGWSRVFQRKYCLGTKIRFYLQP